MIKHGVCEVFVRFGFMVRDFGVFPVKGRVLDDVEISNVYCVLQWVWRVDVKKIFVEDEGF